MKLLIINSNSSASVTELVRDEATSLAAPGTTIEAMTAPFGPAGIETPADVAVAAEATRVAITKASPPDVAIIACFSDPGLLRIRREVPFPVIGIAEAAMYRASELGPRFSILTIAPTTVPGIRALADDYGTADQLAGIHALPSGVLQSHHARERTLREMTELARRVLVSDQPDVIVLGGAITAGMSRQLAAAVSVPVLDGLSCAIREAECLASKAQRLRM